MALKLLNELLREYGEYEEEHLEKKHYDEKEAKEHSKEFLDRAAKVLNYNRKPGDENEVERLALQFAKDYYEAICDEIKGKRYTGKKSEEETDVDADLGAEPKGAELPY